MEINLTKAGESVKSIAVTGTPTGGSETTYTMTCTDAQSIAEKTAFYLSVAAGNYNKIVITDSEDKVCTLTAASGITVAANHIKPLTFADSKLDFKPNLPSGALPGVFTVSDDDGKTTKQIYFSQGNLWADGSNALHFENAQWKSTPASNGTKDATHVSHFTWSDNVTDAVGNSYSGSNLVFLPAAGYRNGSKVYLVGDYGLYWSSSASDESSAYRVLFGSRNVSPGSDDGRGCGYSVRLITESK